MKLANQMRKWGRICFVIMGIAFAIFFVGMVSLPPGGYDLGELPLLVRISVVIGLFFFPLTLILILGSNVPRMLTHRALQTNGLTAEARILKVWETGTRINRSPVIRMLLEVRPPDQPAFQAETEQLISTLQIINVQPGAVIPVKYDPKSLEVALLDTRKTKSTGSSA